MARAVAFNLRHRVAQIERDIANAELEKSNFEMLPAFDLNASRDRKNISTSITDDRISNTASATFAWNILDLGVSYARANQQADEVLIKQEQERKALQDIIRQVNAAFWRAAAGQRLLTKVHTIARDLQVAMEASREMERTGATDVISAVSFRRTIVESVKQALAIRRELQEAKSELAELLNIRPGTNFELAQPAINAGLPRLPMSIENLEVFALENRPELRVEKYNERIGNWQAREALYNLLPGLKVSAGQNYNSDSSSLSPNWISTGVNVGMNLFSLFSGSSEYEIAEGKAELARRQRLALSLAVLTQVHMSRIRFQSAAQQMRLAHEIAESDRSLTQLVRTDGQFLNNDYFEAVRLATQQLLSEMNEQRSYVDLVSAHADLMHAVGLDLFLDTVPFNDIPALGRAIRAMMAQWTISDGTATEPAIVLPLDQLVNSMISVGNRADPLISAATTTHPAKHLSRKTGASPAETLFTTGIREETELAASLPEIFQPTSQPILNNRQPDHRDGASESGQNSSDISLIGAARRNSVQPENDLPPETIEELNKIAPSSQANPSETTTNIVDRKVPVRPVKLGPPPTIGGRDETPGNSETATGNAQTGGEKHNEAKSEKDLNHASFEPIIYSTDWEFSARPGTSGSPSTSGGPNETLATNQTTAGNTKAGAGKHNDAKSEKDLNRATVERMARMRRSSPVKPSKTSSHPVDWEFSTQSLKSGSRNTVGDRDKTAGSSQIPARNSPAGVTKHFGAQPKENITPETIEWMNRIAPSSRGKPSETNLKPMVWEFSIPPAKL